MTAPGCGMAAGKTGTFEVDIVPVVKSMTKYAVMVMDPRSIRFHLEKALHLAMAGRPGPVLLDLPLDIQGALIDPDELKAELEKSDNLIKDMELNYDSKSKNEFATWWREWLEQYV